MSDPPIPSARDIMAGDLVRFTAETPIMEAAALLLEHRISGAPVVDDRGRLVGVLSEFDCIRQVASSQYHEDHNSSFTVGDLMSDSPFTIPPDTDIFGVAHELVTHRVRRLPVVENGAVIGLVTRGDVFKSLCDYIARKTAAADGKQYPDYPHNREPIQDYPKT